MDTNKLYEIIGKQYVAALEMIEKESALMKKFDEEISGVKATENTWWEMYNSEKKKVEEQAAMIEKLEAELEEKDEIIKGFHNVTAAVPEYNDGEGVGV